MGKSKKLTTQTLRQKFTETALSSGGNDDHIFTRQGSNMTIGDLCCGPVTA
jgi:hypothetical protein